MESSRKPRVLTKRELLDRRSVIPFSEEKPEEKPKMKPKILKKKKEEDTYDMAQRKASATRSKALKMSQEGKSLREIYSALKGEIQDAISYLNMGVGLGAGEEWWDDLKEEAS